MDKKTHVLAGAIVGLMMARGLHFKSEELIPVIRLPYFSYFNRYLHNKYLLSESIGMVGGFLPDIDIPLFRIKQDDKLENKPIHKTEGWKWDKHRGITHTFIFIIILSLIFMYFHHNLGFVFFIGAITHILLDSLNKTPMKLFYPLSKVDVCFYQMTVDSFRSRILIMIPMLIIFTIIGFWIFGLKLWLVFIIYLMNVSIITILARNIYLILLALCVIFAFYYFKII